MFKPVPLKTAIFFLLLVTVLCAAPTAFVHAKENYEAMVNEIGVFLNEALSQYKKGNVQEAKQKAQAAYLEVFENLEGPIRINVSAKKNYELEQEFVAIRNMIVEKKPANQIAAKIDGFMKDLREVTAKLEGGFELVAEGGDAKPAQATGSAGGKEIEGAWQQAFENIRTRLGSALDLYGKGDAKGAAELVVQTQYDEYKNSLFETAVRRNVSQKKDYENNAGFGEIASLMSGAAPVEKVGERISQLLSGLEKDLPGLPLVDGVESSGKKSAAGGAAEKNWDEVNITLFAAIDSALSLYESGKGPEAVAAMQDTYFDIFEGSGMEAKIGARDANFKAQLEGHFNMLVGQMKGGASAEAVRKSVAAMKVDFEEAASLLGKGSDSPAALFIYSLMIILREGIEAILIITAIIAYLVKTGHQNKLKVIYNGCITALVLSVITALLVKWVFNLSAASQEVVEGGTMLLASLVLFSVSYWLISKAESQKWVTYIREKVGDSVSSNSLKALWLAAFLAVYREGAETVLFYQALVADSSSAAGITAVAGGFVVGCLLLVALYLGMRYGALRLPIRPFFLGTGALLYFMAFVFAGNGMMELVEGKMFEGSLVSWMPTIQFMGIHPYVQTLVPQFLIVLAAVVALVIMGKRKTVPAEQ